MSCHRSAADWYIINYLHEFVQRTKSRRSLRMSRIYATYRNPSTIPSTVLPYVLMDDNRKIRLPDKQTVRESQIVVTTLTTAINLISDDMRGCFSHILIDEAGQVLEAEALIPLALATEETCVVLAGDHMQMSPKVVEETFSLFFICKIFHFENLIFCSLDSIHPL